MDARATRRSGISDLRLLGYEDSRHQNVVLVRYEQGAEVEMHRVENSESFFVLQGEFAVTGPSNDERLEEGDFCYFPPGGSHGLKCLRGPGEILVVFAPARSVSTTL